MTRLNSILLCILLLSACAKSQNNTIIGGPCEGCEAIYENKNKRLKNTDTFPGFSSGNEKIMISGVVYQLDGKTPASNVILYLYHTDTSGKYPKRDNSTGWEARHGYLRIWLKTNEKGIYKFYTTRPASYPNSSVPQHIHIVVKEPNKLEYYVEDFFFSDDPHITPNIVNRKRPRGGSGVITLQKKNDILEGKRDIILGLHIPNY